MDFQSAKSFGKLGLRPFQPYHPMLCISKHVEGVESQNNPFTCSTIAAAAAVWTLTLNPMQPICCGKKIAAVASPCERTLTPIESITLATFYHGICSVRQRLVSNNERCPKIRIGASETRLESPRKNVLLLFFYALIDYGYQRAAIFLIHLWFTDQYSKLQIHNRKHLTFLYTERQRRQKPIYYRPQTKFAKVMFSHVSIILSTGGGCLGPGPGGRLGNLASGGGGCV